jgi:hypothetical protein
MLVPPDWQPTVINVFLGAAFASIDAFASVEFNRVAPTELAVIAFKKLLRFIVLVFK